MPAQVVKVVITGYYPLPDNLYGLSTPEEAMNVDVDNFVSDKWAEAEIIDACERVEVDWSLVDEVPV